jgi:hypothetical protein
MLKRKRQVIKKYGKDQSICFYYYLANPIEYVGEKWVRESFESVVGIGDEPVIIGDYSSTDGTKELAEEFGFNVINIPREEGVHFAEAKVENAIIFNAKSNFMVDLSIHYNYPKELESKCRAWLRRNIEHIDKKILILRGKYFDNEGNSRIIGGSWMVYRPSMIHL